MCPVNPIIPVRLYKSYCYTVQSFANHWFGVSFHIYIAGLFADVGT